MTDNTVARLREVERLVRNSQMDCDDTGDVINWCADEIERLKELVEHLASQVLLQQKANDKAWEAYEQAVRGE